MWLPRKVAETAVGGVHYTAQRGRDTNAISLFFAIVGGNYVPRRNASQIAFRSISGLRAGSRELQVDPLGSVLHTNLDVMKCIKIVTVANFISELFCKRCRDANCTMLRANSSPSHLAICVPTGELMREFPQVSRVWSHHTTRFRTALTTFWLERTFICPVFLHHQHLYNVKLKTQHWVCRNQMPLLHNSIWKHQKMCSHSSPQQIEDMHVPFKNIRSPYSYYIIWTMSLQANSMIWQRPVYQC